MKGGRGGEKEEGGEGRGAKSKSGKVVLLPL